MVLKAGDLWRCHAYATQDESEGADISQCIRVRSASAGSGEKCCLTAKSNNGAFSHFLQGGKWRGLNLDRLGTCKATDLLCGVCARAQVLSHSAALPKNKINVICSDTITPFSSVQRSDSRSQYGLVITHLCLCPQSLAGSRPSPRFPYDPSIFAFHSLSTGPPFSVLTQPEDPSCS